MHVAFLTHMFMVLCSVQLLKDIIEEDLVILNTTLCNVAPATIKSLKV